MEEGREELRDLLNEIGYLRHGFDDLFRVALSGLKYFQARDTKNVAANYIDRMEQIRKRIYTTRKENAG